MIQFLATTQAGCRRSFPRHLLHRIATLPFIAVVGLLTQTLCFPVAEADSSTRPNIVLILADDQGYGDLGCHGNPIIKTPNLDRLGNASVRLTDFHVSPTCAPTRAALMTGRHEFKSGVTHTIFERERLSPTARTLPELLKTHGYTTGIFGKWHLGDEADYQPDRRGFDEVFIHGAGGIGQTYSGSCGDAPGNKYFDPVIRHNGRFVKTDGYCTDVFFDQAIQWIDEVAKDSPFFCYITPNAPHGPLICPPEYSQPYEGQVPDDVAKFYGMITNIDDNIGRLTQHLADQGLSSETLVIFMTDNGTATGAKVYNAGMRAAKGSPYNGGTRVPGFWHWPDRLAPRDVAAFTCHWDIVPTIAEIIGAELDDDWQSQIEGRSFWTLLQDPTAPWPDRYFFTHVGRWPPEEDPKTDPNQYKYARCSVRWRNYTLVSTVPQGPANWKLYDLTADPSEQTDLMASQADVASAMVAAYNQWWDETLPLLENERATGPAVNPYKTLYWEQYQGPGPNQVPRPQVPRPQVP